MYARNFYFYQCKVCKKRKRQSVKIEKAKEAKCKSCRLEEKRGSVDQMSLFT